MVCRGSSQFIIIFVKLSPGSNHSWAELVITSAFPATHPTTHPEKTKTAWIQHDDQNESCFYQWVGPKNYLDFHPTTNGARLTLI